MPYGRSFNISIPFDKLIENFYEDGKDNCALKITSDKYEFKEKNQLILGTAFLDQFNVIFDQSPSSEYGFDHNHIGITPVDG